MRTGVDSTAFAAPSRESERCTVPGCGGFLIFPTDGNGRVLAYCEACEQRVRQVRTRFVVRAPSGAPAQPATSPTAPGNEDLVARVARTLTDAQLATLLDERLISFGDAVKEFRLTAGTITKAVQSGEVKGFMNRTRCYFLFRRSFAAWREQRRRYTPREQWKAHLPRRREDAMTASELRARHPATRWDVQLSSHKTEPWLHRVKVDRPGARRAQYAYWYQEAP